MLAQQVVVYSDLDGTLLDHYTYESTPALPIIKQLNAVNIPVVLTTSKTLAEVTEIQTQLNITAPLIVENGAAIFIPKNTFRTQPEDTTSTGKYWVKSFCQPRQYWLDIIKNAPEKFKGLHQGFSVLTIDELVKITGLDTASALLAKDRQYGEPIHWLGSNEEKVSFVDYLKSSGATVLQGGRFFHVSGASDKGRALTWLTERYTEYWHADAISTIALGDGENDIAMLEAADVAVQIRSPVHEFPKLKNQNNIVKTEAFGPAGWALALQHLLVDKLPTEHFSTQQTMQHSTQ